MANDADAELNIVVNDNVAQASSRILGQVRALGTSMGVEANKIDKTAASVAKSLNRMTDGGVGAASGTYSKSIAAATSNLAKYRAEMERLNHVENAKTNSAGKQYDTSTGRLISRADLDAYDAASVRVKIYGDELDRLQKIQAQAGTATKFQAPEAVRVADFDKARAAAEGLGRSTKDLERLYSDMWGKVDSINGKGTSWFPPQMLRSTEDFTKAIMGASNATRYLLYDVSRNLAIAGAASIAFGAAGIVMAARWESAFAEVERTVGGSESTLERIRTGLIGLSQDIPVSFTNLSEIAALGAQMGIAADGVVAYTDVIAKLTATTNLTGDAAGKALGRFKSFFSAADDPSLAVTDRTFTNLASSILKVGINSVATETGIVNVATQISSMGSYAGFTADQVVGLAGALSSVGVPPELSRGVTARLFSLMGEAASSGGESLERFAHVAGVSAADFKAAWGTDEFAYVFTDFISGLNDLNENGGKAITTLNDLGIRGVRDVPVLLRLAGAAGEAGIAGGLLAQTMNDARSGWRDNIELQLQYQKIAQTLSSRFQVLIQNFEALFATMGQSSTGPIKALVDFFIQLTRGMTELANNPVGQFFSTVAIGAAILLGGITLLAAGFARASAVAVGFGQAIATIPGAAGAATAATNVLKFALLGLGVVGIIAAVAGSIMAISAAGTAANNAITDTNGALTALREDTKNNLDGVGGSLFEISVSAEEAAGGMKLTATQADNLASISTRTSDRLYGTADAAKSVGSAMEASAFQYGKAAVSFTKSSLLASTAFTDLFKPGNGADGFADALIGGGFDLDKAITLMGRDGRDAAKAYIEGFTGVATNESLLGNTDFAGFGTDGIAVSQRRLLDQLEGTKAGFEATGRAALIAGGGVIQFKNATEITTESLEEFQSQNQEVINQIAEGYAKFVDPASLIGFTQSLNTAMGTLDDGTTEINEHDVAIADFETSWRDAYGGASFSISSYMDVFRRAAGEQEKFIGNIQTLAARGVPTNIIADLSAMGPQAQSLVQALVDGTDQELGEYVELYGSTGFDSMVALAAGQLAAQNIVREAARTLSTAQLQQLSADLSAGTPLVDAMAKWQLDANGRPIDVPAKARMDFAAEQSRLAQEAWRLGIGIPVTPRLTKSNYSVVDASNGQVVQRGQLGLWAQGGYTGPGGMMDPAGIVHKGEYVHPKKDVDQTTGLPKPEAMLRMMRGGRQAPKGGGSGYATGGFVGGTTGITHLAPEERQLLTEIRDALRRGLTITDTTVGAASNAANVANSQRSRA